MIKPTKEKIKMSIKPPGQVDEKEAAALEFISAAPGGSIAPEAPPTELKEDILPWEEPGVREDVVKQYNLRLPEPDLLKLRYVVEDRKSTRLNSSH
jgi:hypothetical protein